MGEREEQMAHVLWREAVRNGLMWVTYMPHRAMVMPGLELQPRAMCRPVTLLLQSLLLSMIPANTKDHVDTWCLGYYLPCWTRGTTKSGPILILVAYAGT